MGPVNYSGGSYETFDLGSRVVVTSDIGCRARPQYEQRSKAGHIDDRIERPAPSRLDQESGGAAVFRSRIAINLRVQPRRGREVISESYRTRPQAGHCILGSRRGRGAEL